MTGQRHLSQAISEGDGISLIVPAADAEAARMAEAQGAEGVIVDRELVGLREATRLPILWRAEGSPAEALALGALAGCFATLVRILLARRRLAAAAPAQQLHTRGPAGYAGPGSLGGTESALRR